MKIKFQFDSQALLEGLKQKRNAIKTSLQEAVNVSAQEGVQVAKQQVLVSYHTQKEGDTLANNIVYNPKPVFHFKEYRAEILTNTNNNQLDIKKMYYLEYGAGNPSHKHPLAVEINWIYDLTRASTRTKYGWFYYSSVHDKNPNKWEMSRNKTIWGAFTKESEPTMFIYKTREYLKTKFVQEIEMRLRKL